MVEQSKSHFVTNGIKIIAFIACAIYALTENETLMETAAENGTTNSTAMGLSVFGPARPYLFVQDCHVCWPIENSCDHCTHYSRISVGNQTLQNTGGRLTCNNLNDRNMCQNSGNTCMEGSGCRNCMTEGQVEQSWYHNGQLGVMQCVNFHGPIVADSECY